jgi:plasmid replication initiation protein
MESARIQTTPYELLKGIARGTSGTEYKRLYEAISRLRGTAITTNIRAGRKQHANFNWLAEFEGEGNIDSPEQLEQVKSIALTLPRWIYDAVVKTDNVLSLDREYFLLTAGLDRVLYRMARKHAGKQPQGWLCSISQLQKKSGSDASDKKFAEMLRKTVKSNKLPRYQMTMTTLQDGSPAVHFVDRKLVEMAADAEKTRAELARIEQLRHEDERAELIDSGKNPRH